MTDTAPSVLDRLRALLASRYTNDPAPDALTNLVPNGSFEHDTAGAQPAGWDNTSDTVVAASFTGSLGTKVLNVGAGLTQTRNTGMTPASPVTPGKSYRASCPFQQTSAGGGDLRLQIKWYDSVNALISTDSGTFGPSGAANSTGTISVTATAPANAATAKVFLDKGFTTSTYRVDAIMLCPAAQVAGYGDGDSAGWKWAGTVGNSIATKGRNPTSDEILEAIIGGISDAADKLGIVAFGADGIPPGRALTDPSVAPDWALPHASLYTSGGLLPGKKATETYDAWLARARDAAVYPLGIKAGTDEAITRTIKPLLTGTQSVFITIGSDPYVVQVRTLPAETPDQTAVINALMGSYQSGGQRGALRAEMGLDYAVSNSPQFTEATRTFTTVTATATSTNVTRTDVT